MLFVHLLGFTAWLGAGLSMMITGIRAKKWPAAERLVAYRVCGVLARTFVGPGAALVLGSGFGLIGPYMSNPETMTGRLSAMMSLGTLGAMLALGVMLPTASRLGSLRLTANGELPAEFPVLRKRLAIWATAAGVLGLGALVSATMF
jgi:hypothetical protein